MEWVYSRTFWKHYHGIVTILQTYNGKVMCARGAT